MQKVTRAPTPLAVLGLVLGLTHASRLSVLSLCCSRLCVCVFKVLLKSISKHLNSFFLILENIFSRDLGDCVFDGRREGRQHFWGKILSVAFHELL